MSSIIESATEKPQAVQQTDQAFRIARIVLGCLLAAAVALKFYGLKISSLPHVGWAASGKGWVAVIAWECTLAIWLISGAQVTGAWVFACITFLIFGAYSAYSWMTGAVNCSCFGPIQTVPWQSLGIDIGALALLAFCVPRLDYKSALPKAKVVGTIAAIALLVLATIAGLGSILYGSPQ